MASVACCTPAPPAVHYDEGADGSIGDLKAYLNKPPSATAAIILMSDIAGSGAPLLRKLADKIASAGYYAVLPDFFRGDPYVAADSSNFLGNLATWIAKHQPAESVEDTRKVIKELKDQGIKSIGCSGFCWGAALAVPVLKVDPNVDAIVILHPSLVTPADLEDIEKPIAILGAEIDELTTPEMLEQMREVLEAKPEMKSFVKLYHGQKHGWTIRYDVNEPFQVKGALEAHDDMLEFYKKVQSTEIRSDD